MSRKKTNRGKLEIALDILKALKKSKLRTPLMYETNMSFVPLKGYLKKLERGGFLKTNREGLSEIISLTEKGHKVVRILEIIDELREVILTENKG